MARDHGDISQSTTPGPVRGLPRGQQRWAPWQRLPRLERPVEGRVLAGVATAAANALGITPLAARVAFAALCFAGGAGLALYVAGWLFLPPAGGGAAIVLEAWPDRRTRSLVLAVAAALVALLVLASAAGAGTVAGALAPGVVGMAGLVAIWRHAPKADREAAAGLAALLGGGAAPVGGRSAWRRHAAVLSRLVVGLGLVAAGLSGLLAPQHLTSQDLRAALAALAFLVGVGLIFAPWWLTLGRELATERRARLRAQERAEIAEHLHDSVLQTLALIQRSADDSHKVVTLARSQERQLRRWLFEKNQVPEPGTDSAATLAEAMANIQRDVEDAHDIKVELVMVGDAALDEELRAMAAAAREAVVNAAKWSGAGMVSVFCEVEPAHASVFVLDRGVGFDPEKVGPDRKGISESIRSRVARRGGSSRVRSGLGEGTEVTIRMPRREQG